MALRQQLRLLLRDDGTIRRTLRARMGTNKEPSRTKLY